MEKLLTHVIACMILIMTMPVFATGNSNRLCVAQAGKPETKTCHTSPREEVPILKPNSTREEVVRYENYQKKHRKYFTCRVMDPRSGNIVMEYLVSDYRYCK